MQAGELTAIHRLLNLGIVTRFSAPFDWQGGLRGKTFRTLSLRPTSRHYTISSLGEAKSSNQMVVATLESPAMEQILPALRAVVPALSDARHKGQAGKLAVIGGCREYTGAPYFSAITALKLGADLSHVFCTQGAASVIKSYSPELIVHPILEESHDVKGDQKEGFEKVLAEISKWLGRFDCLVIGPGLGRDPLLLDCVAEIIRLAKQNKIPLVIDGDGLFLITNDPGLVCGYPLAILTPNVNEHKRLVAKMKDSTGNGPSNWRDITDEDPAGQLKELARLMGGLTIVQKGKVDHISDGVSVFASGFLGSPRRCGGQGDVLSGCIGVFMAWARDFYEKSGSNDAKSLVEQRLSKNPAVIASVAGSLILRKAASEAFGQKKRSMLTTDIIDYLGVCMEQTFPA